jgi:hypothetical protein
MSNKFKIPVILILPLILGMIIGFYGHQLRGDNRLDKIMSLRERGGFNAIVESKLSLDAEQKVKVREALLNFSPIYFKARAENRLRLQSTFELLEIELEPHLDSLQQKELNAFLFPRKLKRQMDIRSGSVKVEGRFLKRVKDIYMASPELWLNVKPVLEKHRDNLHEAQNLGEFKSALNLLQKDLEKNISVMEAKRLVMLLENTIGVKRMR